MAESPVEKRRKILIADDDRKTLSLLSEWLEREGYEVTSATSGKDALRQASSEAPDCMLLDLNMPQLDGYSLLLRLKENDRTSRIPIVILSTQPEDENQDICRTFGPIQFVEKPFRIADVACKVAHALT
ncbi:MAG: response regulator [Planctomycetota bacterium]|nr:response regulator [Planctomycetota bacterium]